MHRRHPLHPGPAPAPVLVPVPPRQCSAAASQEWLLVPAASQEWLLVPAAGEFGRHQIALATDRTTEVSPYPHRILTGIMDYAEAAPPGPDPHPIYPHPFAYTYTYAAYHQPDPSAASSSSSSYSNHTTPADTQAYGHPAAATGGSGLADYYFTAGEAARAVSAGRPAPAATGRQTGKHFSSGYVQVAAVKAPRAMAPAAAATVTDLAQPVTCEVCNIQCDTLEVLMIHKTGKKHKKNMTKLQHVITPKPANPPNSAVGASTGAAAAVADGVMPAVQPRKNKRSAATPADLVKKRRVLEPGAPQGEVKICTVCNVVVSSEKDYQFHIAGRKYKVNVQK